MKRSNTRLAGSTIKGPKRPAVLVTSNVWASHFDRRITIRRSPPMGLGTAVVQALNDDAPFRGNVIHAQWSGEAIWSPLSTVWPNGSMLELEYATGHPKPAEVLLFVDYRRSEPELLIAYGATRFACKAGPVLLIGEDLPRLVECGREILMHGANELRIDRPLRSG